jgi:hypothetical protein
MHGMDSLLRYGIAFVVACHGLTYILFGFLAPPELKGWRGRSLLLGSAVSRERLGVLVIVLHAAAGIVTIACGVAIAFAPTIGLWPLLAIVSGAAGLIAFAVFIDGQARLLVGEGAIGAVLSVVLVVAGIGFGSAFG